MKRLVLTIIILALAAAGVIWYAAGQPKSQKQDSGYAESSSAPSESMGQPDKQSFEVITAEEAKKMMEEGGVTIVDVRRQDEYDAGHIKNAILVPNESIGKTDPEALPDKDAVLLVYCRTGRRSRDASQKLADLGYTRVYDFGGITDWPYETEK